MIREMSTNDLDQVVAIATSSISNPWSRNMFLEEMLNPLAYCFIYGRRGLKELPLGFICFRNVGDESELLNIGVHPQYRQMGIGKNLMRFYFGFCKGMGIKRSYLEVDSLNQPAIHLYQLSSYRTQGMRKKFYRGKSDALLMVKKI
jgi:ribosomal-protein-alanine N-acetyltransferase